MTNVWQTALERSIFQAVAVFAVWLVARFDDRVALPGWMASLIIVGLVLGNVLFAAVQR